MKEQEQISAGWAGKGWLPQLFIKYRINSTDFHRLWAAQEGRCTGCRIAFAHPFDRAGLGVGVKPEVDHKHGDRSKLQPIQQCEAKDVRGLLCRRCNDFLGKIQDNMDTLQNLVNYLKRHGDWK